MLKIPDPGKHHQYCAWFLDFIHNVTTHDKTLQSTVSLNGYINSQNTRICATENPHTLHDVPLYAEKIGVWCALSQMGIEGILYFNYSADSDVYRDLVQQFVAMFYNQMNVTVGFSKTVQPATLLNH